MYLPPAVTWDVKPARWHRVALWGLALCATGVAIGFCALQGLGASSLLLLLALLIALLLGARAVKRLPSGPLNWDGAQWHWLGSGQEAVSELACVLDLQNLMLVQLRSAGASKRYLWLECQDNTARWTALRRAVVAAARQAPSTDPQPEA